MSGIMSYFLPRECPKCERLISPAERPRVGAFARCPYCRAMLRFVKGLMLRPATQPETINAEGIQAEGQA